MRCGGGGRVHDESLHNATLRISERLASISVDWSQWMDEEEELAVRQHPLGHNAAQMKGAMGTRFGSNLERDLAARRQAQQLDTSKGDEEDEEEITLC